MLRGKLFSGALFAGLLFGANPVPEQPQISQPMAAWGSFRRDEYKELEVVLAQHEEEDEELIISWVLLELYRQDII